MRQLMAGFLSLTALLGLTPPLQAQEMVSPPVTPSCTATLTNAQKRLESGRQLKVGVTSNDVTQSYADHPSNRPFEYTFVLRGPANRAVMHSPKFIATIATDVIQACETVSLVTFVVADTDHMYLLGLMPNGQVEAFDCLEPTRIGKRPAWGQVVCL